MSYLTQSYDKLKEDLITALEGEGFPYNPNTTSFTEYLSVALGNSSAHLRKSLGKLLSDLDAQYGGSLSELRASIAHLVDDTITNIGAGGGGGGGYPAKAAEFDGISAFGTSNLLNGAVSATGTFFVWQKVAFSDSALNISYFGNGTDEDGNGCTANFYSFGGDFNPTYQGKPVFQTNTSDYSSTIQAYGDGVVADDTWHLVAMSWDMNHETGLRTLQIMDGETLQTITWISDDGPAFEIDWLTPQNFFVGTWTSGGPNRSPPNEAWIGGLSDFFLDIHNSVDLSDPAVVAKIISDGKPVSLGPTGSLLTGSQPLFYLGGSRDNYHDNLGNGGPLTLFTTVIVNGRADPGPVTVASAQLGQAVQVIAFGSTDVSSDFESTVSVAGQVQQTGAVDYSAESLRFRLTGGSLPNATTSPSD